MVLTSILGLAYDKATIKHLLEGKLAVMALILAVGMFQYQLLLGMIDRYQARLNNPAWLGYFERVGAQLRDPSASQELRAEYESKQATWAGYTRGTRAFIRDGLVTHNFAILANVLAVSAALFVSVAADAVLLLMDGDSKIWRGISSGAFFFSALPFLGLTARRGAASTYGVALRRVEESLQPPQ